MVFVSPSRLVNGRSSIGMAVTNTIGPGPLAPVMTSTAWRCARVAMIVSVGLWPPEDGNTAPSATNRLSRWWNRPSPSVTLVRSSLPMRMPPMMCSVAGTSLPAVGVSSDRASGTAVTHAAPDRRSSSARYGM